MQLQSGNFIGKKLHGAGHNDQVTRNDSRHDDDDYDDDGAGDDDGVGDDDDDDRAGDDDDAFLSCDTLLVIPLHTYVIDGRSVHSLSLEKP